MQSFSGNNSSGDDSSSNGNGTNQKEDTPKIISITAMTHSNKDPCPAFLVQSSKRWLSLFKGLEHECVEEYRCKNRKQYATVLQQQQTYQERRCSKREATKKQTTLLSTLCGSQRVSRSQAQEMRGAQNNSASSSTLPPPSSQMNSQTNKCVTTRMETSRSGNKSENNPTSKVTDSSRKENGPGVGEMQGPVDSNLAHESFMAKTGSQRVPCSQIQKTRKDSQISSPTSQEMSFDVAFGKLEALLNKEEDDELFFQKLQSQQILQKVLKTIATGNLQNRDAEHRDAIVSEAFSRALKRVPDDYLAFWDSDGNTLLHLCVEVMPNLSMLLNKLIEHGAPLHVRNKNNMTVVEQCIYEWPEKTDILEHLIQHGGTFHHFLDDQAILRSADQTMNGHVEWVQKTIRDHYEKLDAFCGEERAGCFRIARRFRELQHGPIVCFPPTNFAIPGRWQEIEFVVPENWVRADSNAKYMFFAIHTCWDWDTDQFWFNDVSLDLDPPLLCGEQGRKVKHRHLSSCEGHCYFDPCYEVTEIVQKHFKNVIIAQKESIESRRTVDPRILKVSSNYKIFTPTEPEFLMCQLIQYEEV